MTLTLSALTQDPVKIACKRCGRSGAYRKSTILKYAGVEAGTVLPEIANIIAKDKCEDWSELGNKRCFIYFLELADGPDT
jgi:hypothetical protein